MDKVEGMVDHAAQEARAYRRALGSFATGVCLITAHDQSGPAAITVNSFTSVSLDPRLVLWCLDAGSDRYALFAAAEQWGVTVLRADQQDLSARFSRPGACRIEPELLDAFGSAPVLKAGLARLGCVTHERIVMGDHLILVGRVEQFAADDGDGLTYFKGRYGLAPTPAG